MEILKKVKVAMFICLLAPAGMAQNIADLPLLFGKSYQLEAEKKYVEAIKVLEAANSDSNYEVNLRLGWLYYLAGLQEKSVAHYQKCSHIMPTACEPLWGVLNPYVAKSDWVNAEKTYLTILNLDPKNYNASYRLGLIYYYRKNYTAAKKYFDIILNLFPFDYDAMLMSGWTNYFLNNHKDAKVLFQKVLLNRPNDSSALEGLALIK